MRLSPTPHLSRAACARAWRPESHVAASHVVRALQERETALARSVLAQPVSAPRCLPRNRRTTDPALRAWGNRLLCFRNLRRIDRVPYARRENLLQPAAETRRPGLFSQCPLHRDKDNLPVILQAPLKAVSQLGQGRIPSNQFSRGQLRCELCFGRRVTDGSNEPVALPG